MKSLVVAVAAVGAMAGLATPAQAEATADLDLWTSWQPAVVKVNGKPVEVNGGYNFTRTVVPQGRVELSVQRKVDIGGRNCGYFDSFADGYRSPERTVDVGADGASFIVYYSWNAC